MRKCLARPENKDPTDRAKALEIEARLCGNIQHHAK